MSVNLEMSPRLPTRKAAERYAFALGYQLVGKFLIKGGMFALIEFMPASGTYKVIEGVPTC